MARKTPPAPETADVMILEAGPTLAHDDRGPAGQYPFSELAGDIIEPHPANPRRITDEHPSLDGLADSIRTTGLIQPITVRKMPREGLHEKFQILAGERRWRAYRKAFGNNALILARVVDVTDDQAFDILTVENLQREGLHWLEEARGVAAMIARGRDAETIAKSIGRSPQWVAVRAKLSTVSPKWQKEVDQPDGKVNGWPMAMLEIVARLPLSIQEEMLDDWNVTEAETVSELQKYVDQTYLLKLKSAPWSLDDAKLLPKAGACSACPKRSSCQQSLFADTAGDRCTDSSCWNKKAEAMVARQKTELAQVHPDLKTLSRSYDSEVKSDFSNHDIKECKQGAKGAIPLLIVAGDGKGSLIWGQKYGGYDSSTGKREVLTKPAVKQKMSIDERMKAVEKKRARLVCEKFVKWFKSCKEMPVPLTIADLVAIAAKVGTHHKIDRYQPGQIAAALNKETRWKELEASSQLWLQVRQTLLEAIEWATNQDDPPLKAVGAVTLLDKDWAHQYTEWINAARKEIPVPKSLQADIDDKGSKPKAKAAAAR